MSGPNAVLVMQTTPTTQNTDSELEALARVAKKEQVSAALTRGSDGSTKIQFEPLSDKPQGTSSATFSQPSSRPAAQRPPASPEQPAVVAVVSEEKRTTNNEQLDTFTSNYISNGDVGGPERDSRLPEGTTAIFVSSNSKPERRGHNRSDGGLGALMKFVCDIGRGLASLVGSFSGGGHQNGGGVATGTSIFERGVVFHA